MPIKYYYNAYNKKIPECVCPRLSMYYRALSKTESKGTISSNELADYARVTPAQVRRDLTYFGHFGIPGKGYQVDDLRIHLLKILGMDHNWNIALIGMGVLSSALLSWNDLRKQGFNIICAFDNDIQRIGKVVEGIKVQDISELPETIKMLNIQIAVVMISDDTTSKVIELIVQEGVSAIINFSTIRHDVPEHVHMINIDLLIEMEKLSYFLTNLQNGRPFFYDDM
jgi:redox-sensing transcriptional repressor